MQLDINNKIALITGASQGIGKAIAMQLAKEGVRVAITSSNPVALDAAMNEIKSVGGEAIAIPGDATIETDIKRIVDETIYQFGTIDILINNVGGIGQIHAFEEISTHEWHDLFNLNVMSGVHFTQAVLPYMKKAHWGKIIFLSSEKGIEPGVFMSHYSMTKAAILSLAKSLANELGKDGITVNSISPGVIVTPSWDGDAKKNNLSTEDYAAKFCRNVLEGQPIGKPEDVAELVCFLCSESARWITGSNIRIDGGSVPSLQL